MKSFTKNVFIRSSIYFTFIVTLFSIFVLLNNSSESSISLDPARVILMLPFSICFAIANTTLKYKNLEAFTRWTIHAALTVISSYLFIILPAGLPGGATKFIGFVLIAFTYIIFALIYALFSTRVRKAITEDSKLKSKSNKKH